MAEQTNSVGSSSQEIPTLVTAQWLKEQILPEGKSSNNIRVLDASWIANKDGYQLYQQEHIPSALHFDLEKITTPKEDCVHKKPIPEPEVFRKFVENLGISNDTYIIMYDGTKYRPSFRAWFLFRLFGHDKISVMNGGLAHWKSLGYPTTKEQPTVQPGTFVVNYRPSLIRDFDAMKANLDSKAEQVMDSRGAELFNGAEGSGSPGHIPGAKNIPFPSLMTEDGMFKEGRQLQDLFDNVNVDPSKPVVTLCGTAMSACSLAAAAHMLGKSTSVYNGAFTEWNIMAPDQIEK